VSRIAAGARREALALAPIAAAAVAVTGALAARDGSDGAGATATALLLAPVAVWAVRRIAGAIAGRAFALAATVVYVLLPLAARLYFYGPFLGVYKERIAGELVGLRSPAWFAAGVAAGVAAAALPARVAAPLGVGAGVVGLATWGDARWTVLYGNFHETTWSPTLLSILPFACVLAIGLRDPARSAALGGWLTLLVCLGASRPYEDGFWLALAAAMPANAVLLTGVRLLLPPLRASWAAARPARAP
jgi:hypothetical protein